MKNKDKIEFTLQEPLLPKATILVETPEDAITFSVPPDIEMLKINSTGFYVRGKLVKEDIEIYDAFKEWLASVQLM